MSLALRKISGTAFVAAPRPTPRRDEESLTPCDAERARIVAGMSDSELSMLGGELAGLPMATRIKVKFNRRLAAAKERNDLELSDGETGFANDWDVGSE